MFFDVVANQNRKPKVDSLTQIQKVCISERSFSDLRRFSEDIRSISAEIAEDQRFGTLAHHREISNEINLDEIMDEFINKNPVQQNAKLTILFN